MTIYTYPTFQEWPTLIRRPEATATDIRKSVGKIMKRVRREGDEAIRYYTKKLDGVKLKELRVTEEEIEAAAAQLPADLKEAIRVAQKNIERFHSAQQETVTIMETMPGIQCWRQSLPVEKVGLYIPGGSAPLFSTVLMLGVPASIAGCREIILCTPPAKDGSVHPAILFAAQCCGIRHIIKAGGVQAIAAMAYGTVSVPKVFKIFGPGNQYVTLAKQLVQQQGTAIDMPAGPSEVLVIADETTRPEFAAADLLSQAEHGPDSQVILLSTSVEVVKKINKAVKEQLRLLPRNKIAEQALSQSRAIVLHSMEEAMAFSNSYAPEHLILSCDNADTLAKQVTAAGSVFIGHYSPESAGDYASGTNHTLPTNGYAAMYSGVSVDSFVKKVTYQQLTEEGLQRIGGTVMTMAAAEGLEAHRRAVEIRLHLNSDTDNNP
ncbi:MAG: histidinol dehydrogenase [Bacteroidetes bacterium]|nr:histidinol dehydrogenase [Bacteroidota bacterium]